MKHHSLSSINPLVIFWLGLLTGALIVGLVFFYGFVNSAEYKAATLLKVATPTVKTVNSPTSGILQPTQPAINPTATKAFGDGGGGW